MTLTSCLRDYLIWPLITSWTSSGASLPSLLFSLPQRSQPLPCPLTALPCAWNPISYAWLLHGSPIFFRVSGRHFKTTLLKEKNQSLFNLSILFFLHIVWSITYTQWSTLSLRNLSLQFHEFYICLPSWPYHQLLHQHSYTYCYFSDLQREKIW